VRAILQITSVPSILQGKFSALAATNGLRETRLIGTQLQYAICGDDSRPRAA
jgi:hypothetical protein